MWNTINRLINKKSKVTHISYIKVGKNILTDAKDITNAINDYFTNVGTKLAANLERSKNIPYGYIEQTETEFNLRTISETEAHKLLSSVKPSKSTGYDRIPPKLIKDAAAVITSSLTPIFNNFIMTGILPDELKIAVLSPIFNEGDKLCCDIIIDQCRFYPPLLKFLRRLYSNNYWITLLVIKYSLTSNWGLGKSTQSRHHC